MPVKWDDKATADLLSVLYSVASPGKLSKEQKESLVAGMYDRGYDIAWTAIRYVVTRLGAVFFP